MQTANEILKTTTPPAGAILLGNSRAGRPVFGYRLGKGAQKISLIAGCHADEPVGPLFLTRLAAWIQSLPATHDYSNHYDWWIVPQINPDGAHNNRKWTSITKDEYGLVEYLAHSIREKPGDDIEFGFPENPSDELARPENRAVYNWWRSDSKPFILHVSLHGMHFAGGPWYLIEPKWQYRCGILKERCRRSWESLGYEPHDIQRLGEKGFHRIGKGFCTRPDSRAMKEHFNAINAPRTAKLFRPSSMETICNMGGDPLTLVSEIPLFITPGVGKTLGPPDPVLQQWNETILTWKSHIREPDKHPGIYLEAQNKKLKPMPVSHQMTLQWDFIRAGLKQLEEMPGGVFPPGN